jgi:hypothetical protein
MKALATERVLARAFFARLFESDLMPPGFPQVQLLIWGIAAIAAPAYFLSLNFGAKYSRLWYFARRRIPNAIIADELLLMTFVMMAIGLVALLVWERLFPDRRDVRLLDVLPLRTRTHVIGRLGALGTIAILFAIGANLPAAMMYGPAVWLHGGSPGFFRATAAHLVASAMGGLFTFFLIVAAQGVLLNVFGRRAARRLSFVLQAIFVVGLLQVLLFVPYLASPVIAAFHGAPGSLASWIPSAWFVALEDVLRGASTPVPRTFPAGASIGTLLMIAAATLLLAGSYRRLVRMALETGDSAQAASGRLIRAASAIVHRVAPDPVQRAAAAFTLRALVRSRTHMTLLATYAGVAAAIVVATLLPLLVRHGASALREPETTVLGAPLVFNFFLLCGMRVLFGIPTEVKANWMFRLHAPEDRMPAIIGGVRTALLLAVVAPIAVASGALVATLWGVGAAAVNVLFTAACGVLLLDILLVGLRKIPFACRYYPGGSRMRTLWPFYLLALTLYAYSLAHLELVTMSRPALLLLILPAAALCTVGLAQLRRFDLQPPPGLTFDDDDPDAIFGGFHLSEGLAAERRVAPRRS